MHREMYANAAASPYPGTAPVTFKFAEINSIENSFIGLVDLNPRPVAAATVLPEVTNLISNLVGIQGSSRASGWWDLNPRPPGPEPGALPS
jgi:hypothetical protein